MPKTKLFLSVVIFLFFMILTSIIKTQTRLVEKDIISHKKEISNLKDNLYELQLDYHYLSSPLVISKKINEYSNEDYLIMDISNIYLSFEEFLFQQKKISKFIKNEQKN